MFKRISGLDTSTIKNGYAFFINGKLKKHKLIKAKQKDPFESRLFYIVNEIEKQLKKDKPEILVLEKAFQRSSFNARNAEMLNKIKGAIIYLCGKLNILVTESTTVECNKVWGIPHRTKRKEKKQMTIDFVNKEYNISVTDDEADAITLAMTVMDIKD